MNDGQRVYSVFFGQWKTEASYLKLYTTLYGHQIEWSLRIPNFFPWSTGSMMPHPVRELLVSALLNAGKWSCNFSEAVEAGWNDHL